MNKSHSKLISEAYSLPYSLPRTICVFVMILGAVTILAGASLTSPLKNFATSQKQAPVPIGDVRVLAPGDVVQDSIKQNAAHAYSLTLNAGEFARVVVEQKGVDLSVDLIAADGSLDRTVDNPNGLFGLETLSIAAPVTNTYTIKIASHPTLPGGDYVLRVGSPRRASPADEMSVTAERLFFAAKKLRSGARSDEAYRAAIDKYNEALALWRELGDFNWQGYCLTNLARSYKARVQLADPLNHLRQDHLDQALKYFSEALARLEQAADVSGQAFVLNETSGTQRDLGNPLDAINGYQQALVLRRTIEDRYGQAQVHNNLGLTYSYIGYQPKALEQYAQALDIWRDLEIRDEEINTIVNAGKANAEMGELALGLKQYETVLAFCDKELSLKDSPFKDRAKYLKPYALNGIGLVYDTWANTDEAQAKYREALELFRENGNSIGEADVLNNLGLLYAFLGDAQQALDHFQNALVLRKRAQEPKGWGVTLSNIGYAFTLLEKHEDALRQLELALPLTQRAADKRFEAFTLVRMGMAHVALKATAKALQSYEKAFAIQQDPGFVDRRGQAITLDKMGEALALSGEHEQAVEKYQNALERWTSVGDDQGQVLSLYGIARVERDRHNLANARDRIEEAIRKVENMRNQVTTRQLQMTYFAGKQDLYALAIDVRMQLHELTKSPADLEVALSFSEHARARNLLDLLTEVRVDLTKGMSLDDAETNRRLQQQINALTQTHLRLLSLGAKKDAEQVEQTLRKRMQEQDDLRTRSRKIGASSQPAHPLAAPQIQQLLDYQTILLEFSLDERRSHLWAVTSTKIAHHYLPGRAEINDAALKLRQELTAYEPKKSSESDTEFLVRTRTPPNLYLTSAINLSRMVLGKVWPQLGNKRVVIVADGNLQYIPFEILPAPDSLLTNSNSVVLALAQNEIVYQPSASALGLLRDVARPNSSRTVAVFADPVFDRDDKRVQRSPRSPAGKKPPYKSRETLVSSLRDIGDDDFRLSKLDYSLKEANAITALAGRGSSLKKVGFNANRAAATSPTLKQFNIVHFATHGLVNDKQPELSGIVLSMVDKRGRDQDGYLTLRDIYHLDLPIHLVVVSACRTGIGKQVPGEGLIALTRGFMNAGAQAVVVSLWNVDDEATAEFMTLFYEHMLRKNHLPPSAALRQAKLEMQSHANELWRAPYYWAGFIVQGDWK